MRYYRHYFYYNNVATKEIPAIEGSEEMMKKVKDYTNIKFEQPVFDAILAHIKMMKPILFADDGKPHKDITMNTHVVFDLFFDSLDTAELKSFVQTTYQ